MRNGLRTNPQGMPTYTQSAGEAGNEHMGGALHPLSQVNSQQAPVIDRGKEHQREFPEVGEARWGIFNSQTPQRHNDK